MLSDMGRGVAFAAGHAAAFPRREGARVMVYRPPKEGVGNAGRTNAPAASCAKVKKHTSKVTTVAPVSPG
ncbi:MAG TPA: hypothetical protein VKT76_15040, partial [Bradyrhizobium sp.]|nr:hypothetical protein [Bradyrhizobium sp.]